MAKRRRLTAGPSHPTPLAHNILIPHTPETRRLLTRLTKPTLVSLAARWLSPDRLTLYSPDLSDPADDGTATTPEPMHSIASAAAIYANLAVSKPARAKDLSARLLSYEFRRGLTLLAIAESQYAWLLEKPLMLKWNAFVLASLGASTTRPVFHAATFLASLGTALRPALVPHVASWRHESLPVVVVRVQLHDAAQPEVVMAGRRNVFWLAVPDGSDHIFTSFGGTGETKEAVLAGIAAGVSREGCRVELRSGRLTARGLESMCTLRGAVAASGGLGAGWGIYVDGFEASPLTPPAHVLAPKETEEQQHKKRVKARFGSTAVGDGTAIESIHFEIRDLFPGESHDGGWCPTVSIRMEGSHVFAGVQEMAKNASGVVAIEKLPGWMTGEEGVGSGVVVSGKVARKGGVRFSKA